jgi:hypothetical protein
MSVGPHGSHGPHTEPLARAPLSTELEPLTLEVHVVPTVIAHATAHVDLRDRSCPATASSWQQHRTGAENGWCPPHASTGTLRWAANASAHHKHTTEDRDRRRTTIPISYLFYLVSSYHPVPRQNAGEDLAEGTILGESS